MSAADDASAAGARTTDQCAVHDVTVRLGGRELFSGVELSVRPGEKVGVVGDNGSGKSTVLRLVAGILEPDTGSVEVHSLGGVGYLPQHVDHPAGTTVDAAIDHHLRELHDIEAEMHRVEELMATVAGTELEAEMARYAELTSLFEARDGYRVRARVGASLEALGLGNLNRGRLMEQLSGGERSRVALAVTLSAQPSLLLLDEPTNDLDDDAVSWLEDQLAAHRGTVVAVSHDRLFLGALSTTILEICDGRVHRHGDGYSGYLAAARRRRDQHLERYEQWVADVEAAEVAVDRNAAKHAAVPRKVGMTAFGHGAFRGRAPGHGTQRHVRRSKERLARLADDPVAEPPRPLALTAGFDQAGGHEDTGRVQVADAVVAGRLTVPKLHLNHGDRVLVEGANGAGKSTLLEVLAGELVPTSGLVAVEGRVGYLRQDVHAFDPRMTALEAFAEGRPGVPEDHADLLLSLGLIDEEHVDRRLSRMSIGQRRRIEIARLVSTPVDVILLDEPTNHIAPELVDQLEEAVVAFGGTVVLVSHDRLLRRRWSGEVLLVADGHVGVPEPAVARLLRSR